jgi:hypothetical protein
MVSPAPRNHKRTYAHKQAQAHAPTRTHSVTDKLGHARGGGAAAVMRAAQHGRARGATSHRAAAQHRRQVRAGREEDGHSGGCSDYYMVGAITLPLENFLFEYLCDEQFLGRLVLRYDPKTNRIEFL